MMIERRESSGRPEDGPPFIRSIQETADADPARQV
jgi:hypothetical protein